MWREIIMRLSSQCTFFDPAIPSQINELEIIFGITLPEHLKALLFESNGVFDSNALEVIWNVEQIKTTNLEMRQDKIFRENFMSFDSLLFFGSDIAGDCYGYAVTGAHIPRPSEIFNWSHESDERMFVANSLEAYLKYAL
jgi:hypothetical protein